MIRLYKPIWHNREAEETEVVAETTASSEETAVEATNEVVAPVVE